MYGGGDEEFVTKQTMCQYRRIWKQGQVHCLADEVEGTESLCRNLLNLELSMHPEVREMQFLFVIFCTLQIRTRELTVNERSFKFKNIYENIVDLLHVQKRPNFLYQCFFLVVLDSCKDYILHWVNKILVRWVSLILNCAYQMIFLRISIFTIYQHIDRTDKDDLNTLSDADLAEIYSTTKYRSDYWNWSGPPYTHGTGWGVNSQYGIYYLLSSSEITALQPAERVHTKVAVGVQQKIQLDLHQDLCPSIRFPEEIYTSIYSVL